MPDQGDRRTEKTMAYQLISAWTELRAIETIIEQMSIRIEITSRPIRVNGYGRPHFLAVPFVGIGEGPVLT
jgi:hypothetical protein